MNKQMKYVLIVGDGMADYPIPELGNRTPLQAAYKPNIDAIAAKGQNGLIKTVPDDMPPGSDTAICSVLGYDPKRFCTGRGPIEAAARGIKLGENDTAYRANLVTEKNGAIADYSAGHISTEEAEQLIDSLKALEKPNKTEFFSGLDYRHFLIIRNFPNPELVECIPPHDAIGEQISKILPKAKSPKTQKTASLLTELINNSRLILTPHPVNVAREKAGKAPGNLIWPWGGGKKPAMPSFKQKYGLQATVVSAVDLVKGIATCAGMRFVSVIGATGLYNTNYEGKADSALKALEDHDFVFVHVEAPDEAGHCRDWALKVKTIEDLDKRLVGRILDGLSEPYAIAVLPDHPTPIPIGTHTRDPVPFAIQSPFLQADDVTKFDEFAAGEGAFGLVENNYLVPIFLSSGKKPVP